MKSIIIVIGVLALLAGIVWLSNGRGLNRNTSEFGEGSGGFMPAGFRSIFGRNSIRSLRNEIYSLFGPMDDGARILERTLQSLRRQYPNQTERWYYEKALHDLRRDRGR